MKIQLIMLSSANGGRETPIFSGYKPEILFQGKIYKGEINLPDDHKEVFPGETALVDLTIDHELNIAKGVKVDVFEMNKKVGEAFVI